MMIQRPASLIDRLSPVGSLAFILAVGIAVFFCGAALLVAVLPFAGLVLAVRMLAGLHRLAVSSWRRRAV